MTRLIPGCIVHVVDGLTCLPGQIRDNHRGIGQESVMRAFTTKRRGLGDDGARLVAKQARRERLAFRAVERRVRWERLQAAIAARLGGV